MRNAFSIGRRLIQIVVVLLRVYVLPMLRPGKTRQPPEERFRRALQSLGGAWVKAGQALALRFDLALEFNGIVEAPQRQPNV
jgi:predicted unusual protein kinase regulating ubiquinone biosynthesis (AarF/ABC1/UbiB family)